MIIIIESIILCIIFTLMVYIMLREPIKTLYNYPPKIQERVKSLDEYKDKIPTPENKVGAKIFASVLFLIIICVILRYINGYTTFIESFSYGFLLWTVVNMMQEYHNYWFHINGFFIGEFLALVICGIAGLIIQFVL